MCTIYGNIYCSTDAVEIYTATGASSNASIWKGDFNCSASDTRLINCRRQIRNRNNCSHAEDVGIKCFGKYVGKYYELFYNYAYKCIQNNTG